MNMHINYLYIPKKALYRSNFKRIFVTKLTMILNSRRFLGLSLFNDAVCGDEDEGTLMTCKPFK